MATITLKGNPVTTYGELPANGIPAQDFNAVKSDLSELKLSDYKGKRVVLNIFPSVDTSTCAASVRKFNEEVQNLDNTVVICLSKDLPFAFSRFCGAEGLEDVVTASLFRNHSFGKDYGVEILDGPLTGLMSRAVVLIDENGNVVYSQQVAEIVDEPDYVAALGALDQAPELE